MEPRSVAQIEQESDDYRLFPLPREEPDLLFLAFVENAEVLRLEVADETVLVVRHRNRDDHLVHLNANRSRLVLRGGGGGGRGRPRRLREQVGGETR